MSMWLGQAMTLILPQRLMDPTAILSKSMRFIHETGQQTVNHLENIPFYPQIELPLVILMTLHRQVRHTKYKLKKDFLHQFRPLILFSLQMQPSWTYLLSSTLERNPLTPTGTQLWATRSDDNTTLWGLNEEENQAKQRRIHSLNEEESKATNRQKYTVKILFKQKHHFNLSHITGKDSTALSP